jgi:uncharacterized membrane protein YtjA (UPF0391 family)
LRKDAQSVPLRRFNRADAALVPLRPEPAELIFGRDIGSQATQRGRRRMLNLVVTLLIIGLVAAVLGFGGIAGASFAMAKVIFFIMIVLFLLAVVFGTIGYRRL